MDIGLIILSVIIFIVLFVVGMYIISRSKGKIIIALDKYEFSPGENITGRINLSLKKPVNAKELRVGIIGVSKQVRYGSRSRSSRSGKVFEFKKPIDKQRTYDPGQSNYDFNILIPQNILSQSTLDSGTLGTMIKTAQILSGNINSIKWYVMAELEIAGFNITKKVQINII